MKQHIHNLSLICLSGFLVVGCMQQPVDSRGGGGAGGAGASGGAGGAGGTVGSPNPERHRPAAEACPDIVINPDAGPRDERPAREGDECTTNADCVDGLNGRCVVIPRLDEATCAYDACTEDSDCAEGGVCECGQGLGGVNVCLNDNGCQVDADCGAEGFCSPTLGDCGGYGGVVAYQCRTAEDECTNDSECVALFGAEYAYCAYAPWANRWQCEDRICEG